MTLRAIELQASGSSRERPCFQPAINAYPGDEEIVIVASIPGARPEDIDLQLEGNLLGLRARVTDARPPGASLLHGEFAVGDYRRTFRIRDGIDLDEIDAAYAEGLLTLRLPRTERARPRRIDMSGP